MTKRVIGRAASLIVALYLATACWSQPTPPASTPLSASDFAGAWASVTPSLEFVRLSIVSKSSEQGVLGARITFSGSAWEGAGRIDGDSLVVSAAVAGSAQLTATIVAHARDAQTLDVVMRPANAASVALTLKRED
ncbi:MAG: hypothetical protein ABI969_06660 [bacterium]